MAGSGEFVRFSVRLLAPFRGTVQVVETDLAQAVSTDGEFWRIQVKASVPEPGWTEDEVRRKIQKTLLFGFWTAAESLQRLPGNPHIHAAEIERRVASLLTGLDRYATQVPFTPVDCYELWLLDKHTRSPLVLVSSSKEASALKVPAFAKWQATALSDLSFVAPSMAPDLDPADLQPHHRYRDRLEEIIKHETSGAQWFQRRADGGGVGLAGSGNGVDQQGRELASNAFPELLIRETWEATQSRSLVVDYIAWQAPQLLTLHGLSKETRRRLEKLASKSAIAVSQLYKLYPEQIDSALIKSALVEARMRRAESGSAVTDN